MMLLNLDLSVNGNQAPMKERAISRYVPPKPRKILYLPSLFAEENDLSSHSRSQKSFRASQKLGIRDFKAEQRQKSVIAQLPPLPPKKIIVIETPAVPCFNDEDDDDQTVVSISSISTYKSKRTRSKKQFASKRSIRRSQGDDSSSGRNSDRSTTSTDTNLSADKSILNHRKGENTFDRAVRLLNEPPIAANKNCGHVMIRYNHYHKLFQIHNGVLRWADIDKEYSLSFVFAGNFKREMALLETSFDSPRSSSGRHHVPNKCYPQIYSQHDPDHLYFVDMANHQEYVLEVSDDPALLRINLPAKPMNATHLSILKHHPHHHPLQHHNMKLQRLENNRAVYELTEELKSMRPEQLGSMHAKDLLERRDLEDLLYSKRS